MVARTLAIQECPGFLVLTESHDLPTSPRPLVTVSGERPEAVAPPPPSSRVRNPGLTRQWFPRMRRIHDLLVPLRIVSCASLLPLYG